MKRKQTQNYKHRITLLLFIVFFIIGTIFYRQPFLSLFAILLMIVPVILIMMTKHFVENIKIDIRLKTMSITAGNNIVVIMEVTNPGFIPFLNCELDFTANNIFYDNSSVNTLSFLSHARKVSPTTLTFETSGAGICELDFNNIRITDPLHLYTFYKDTTFNFKVPVIPELKDRDYPLFHNVLSENEDDELAIDGNQPNQDIKEIREYRPGDKLQNIHWKLSAKKDEIMVKELQSNASRVLVITAEMEKENLQDTLSTIWGYMKFLVENREIFKVFTYNSHTFEDNSKLIYNMDDAYEALLNIYYLPVSNSENSFTHQYHDLYGDHLKIIKIIGTTIELS